MSSKLLYKNTCKLYNNYMLKISQVDKNGIGAEIGLEVGDSIKEFDGFEAVDLLDYTFYDYKENFTLTILTKDNLLVKVDIEKDEEETLGLSFESDNLELKTCYNNCIFCFVDQMPKNMRKSLYVKDDDYRQSFLCGNFVTLTNVSDSDIDRIIRLNLSPLYVSVQTMDRELRVKMLNNKHAGNIFEKLKKLTNNGIKIETQIVLVPGVNDGKYLDYSIKELFKLRPNLQSVAVVPCGITKYREGLYPIKDISKEYALCVIEQVRALNASFNENFCVLGDEFYFKAGIPTENAEFYGDYSQLGNGVGGATKLLTEFNELSLKGNAKGKFLLITGESAKEFINSLAVMVEEENTNIIVKVLAVKNDFFGETVNCTGLLTATDIIKAIKNYKEEFDYIVLPDICLKQDEDLFLDDITLQEFKEKINKTIIITNGSAESFVDALTGGKSVRII